jgi:transmembrane sensor
VTDEILFRTLIGRADPGERAGVRAWRKRSRENEQEYQELARILSLASLADQGAEPSAPPDFAAVLSRSGGRTSVSYSDSHQTPQRTDPPGSGVSAGFRGRGTRRTFLALAAAAVLLLVIGVSRNLLERSRTQYGGFGTDAHEFVTGPNESANVVLGDGTVVRLGSDSRLRVPNQTTDREVSISGRAYFAVAKDEARPFTVRTPGGEVRVLGTRFALEALGEDLRLVVIEGRVGLSAPREQFELEAKQVARVIRGHSLPVLTVADPAGVADWVGDFLAFQDTPLTDAVQEIARKFDVRIEFAEASLGERTLTAWFAGYTLEQVMEIVCIVANAECQVADSLVTMRPQS